jgi:hypothetical protein
MEQMMKVLKGYVHNMSHFEGSMVEGYILDDIICCNINFGFVTKARACKGAGQK